MLCTYLNVKFSDIEINEGRYIKIPSIGEIPIDNNGCMLIDYSGDQHVFSETAFQQVLSWGDELEKIRIFENKIVFVGVTATGIGDTGNIPIKTSVPLVTVHANAINTILNKSFIHKMDSLSSFGILVLCIILSTLINILFRPVKAGLLTVFTVMLYVAVSVLLFQKNIWLDILSPGLGFLMPFLLITVYRYGWEEKERRWVKKVFSHYLSSEVINEILKDPSKLKLGGELKTATVLSLDLCNFSAYCEGKCPSDVVGMLNNCFDWMTEIILNNGGMLDKYIGDAIMAIFGAPIEKPLVLQAQQAVNAALEILEKWNLLPEGERCSLNIGIGINTGPMLIGNMGSRYIFNYTAIGDEVNIASRVQGLTRQYAANIIITDSVYNLVKDKFQADSLGEVTVKGRKAPIIIYKVNSTRNKS
jgi:adenylate cyclase